MSAPTESGYGDRVWQVWRAAMRDRLRGDKRRAYARLGYLSPPGGTGRLIWIKSAHTRESVLTGAELVRAVREKRLDVRLAFTFEAEYPGLLGTRLHGMRKAGVGYGPSATPTALRRVLRRFDPLGLVLVGPVHANTWSALAGRKVVAVDCSPPAGSNVVAALATNRAQTAAWQGRAHPALSSGALLSLLVEAQVDPNFKTLVCGGHTLDIWWLHAERADDYIAAWRASPLARHGVLFVSGGRVEAALALSTWERKAITPGSVVGIDDTRWLPAIAASATAIHLIDPPPLVFWQAVAGGNMVSYDLADIDTLVNEAAFPPVRHHSSAELIEAWQAQLAQPLSARHQADALRRLFWAERRRAQTAADALLQHIYDW